MGAGLAGLIVLVIVGLGLYVLWGFIGFLWVDFGWKLLFAPAAAVLIYFVGFIIDKGSDIASDIVDRKWPVDNSTPKPETHSYWMDSPDGAP